MLQTDNVVSATTYTNHTKQLNYNRVRVPGLYFKNIGIRISFIHKVWHTHRRNKTNVRVNRKGAAWNSSRSKCSSPVNKYVQICKLKIPPIVLNDAHLVQNCTAAEYPIWEGTLNSLFGSGKWRNREINWQER